MAIREIRLSLSLFKEGKVYPEGIKVLPAARGFDRREAVAGEG